jgi:hypothetical protein
MISLLLAAMTAGIVLDHAHLVSPSGLAWSNSNARKRMLTQWCKFILFPLALVVLSLYVGLNVNNTNAPAFVILALIYSWWNVFHFAAQNYGICRLFGYHKWWQTDIAIVVTIIPFVMFPFAGTVGLILANYTLGLAHWITDWGLCSWASRRWIVFGGLALVAGLFGLLFKDVSLCDNAVGVCLWQIAVPWLLSLRFGLGFVHFLYSRWVWRHGRELLGTAHGESVLMVESTIRIA